MSTSQEPTPIFDALFEETYNPPAVRPSITERDWWWRAEAAVIGAVIIASLLMLLDAAGYFQ